MSISISGYYKPEDSTDFQKVLEFAQIPFFQLLKKKENECTVAIQRLNLEHQIWEAQATNILEANKPKASKSTDNPVAAKKVEWIPFCTKAVLATLACQGIGFVITQVVSLSARMIIVCSLVIGVAYAFFYPDASKVKVVQETKIPSNSTDLKISAKAELNWLKMKIEWIDAQLKELHGAIGAAHLTLENNSNPTLSINNANLNTDHNEHVFEEDNADVEQTDDDAEAPSPLPEETLEDFRKRLGKEIYELTTLRTHFQEVVNQRYS